MALMELQSSWLTVRDFRLYYERGSMLAPALLEALRTLDSEELRAIDVIGRDAIGRVVELDIIRRDGTNVRVSVP